MKGDRAPAAQLGEDIERELRQLHHASAEHSSVAPVVCTTCVDRTGAPELFPCPTLRIARRLIRLRTVIR